MPRRKVEDSDVGMQVLYEAQKPEVDVVAVHGIGAHREETWSAPVVMPGGQRRWVNWLSDESMLRSKIPNIRVLNFGYKSDWFGSPVKHTLSTLASLLWNDLNTCRLDCLERPIIFVAHCFGGLIVMRVVSERSQHSISQATAGIAFLGTPFRGTDERFHTELPIMAEANIGGQVDAKILQYLRNDNPTLEDLRDAFLGMRTRGLPRVACFFECLATQVNMIVNDPKPLEFVVVDKSSAHLDMQDGIKKYPFQRNHFQLNKFKSPDEGDFKTLVNVLDDFKTVADGEVQGVLKSDIARHQKSILQANSTFKAASWVEEPFPIFDYNDMGVTTLKIKHEKSFKPLASGISLDCRHVFLRNAHHIHIYSMEAIEHDHTKKSISPTALIIERKPFIRDPKDQGIHGTSIGLTVCASITEISCWLHKFVGEEKHQEIRRMSHDNTWRLCCVAVSETTAQKDPIIVALGMQQDRGGKDYGKVELISIWQNDWGELASVQTMHLKDDTLRRSDVPKTLAFSSDGSILTCTTQRENQIHGWKLPTAKVVGKIRKISETSRPFNIGVNARGITSATTWMSPAQHPYILCTTSPSTERENDGGEWSFIAPLSIPFAPWATERAYHCLRQVQGINSQHLHIHVGAISPQCNFIALLDSNGSICLIPIRASNGGGMVSNDFEKPIEVPEALGKNEGNMAGLRFNPIGTKLYGINWNGRIIMVRFPHANAELNRDIRKDSTLTSQSSSGSSNVRSSFPVKDSSDNGSTGSRSNAPKVGILPSWIRYLNPRHAGPAREGNTTATVVRPDHKQPSAPPGSKDQLYILPELRPSKSSEFIEDILSEFNG